MSVLIGPVGLDEQLDGLDAHVQGGGEVVALDLIQAGGFPPFFLQPINFEGLYAETLRQRQEQGDAPSLADSEPAGNA